MTACGSTGIKTKVSSLDAVISDYNVSLRWSMLERIEAYHQGKNGDKKTVDRAALKNIRVTGCTVLEKTLNAEATEALVRGEIDYYTTDTGTLRKFPFTHVWWWSDELKRWFNGSDTPDFKPVP
jgi:hypothetical protein